MLRIMLLPLLALLALAALTCSSDDGDPDSMGGGGDGDRLRVIATTTQIGDLAANVGGEHIDLTVLLQPNQDAHDFELEPSQIRAVSGADLVLLNGAGLDAFIDEAVESSDAALTTLADAVQLRKGGHEHEGEEHEEEGHDDEGHDPHYWFSVENAIRMVEAIRDDLGEHDAANRDAYTTSAAAYVEELETLDADVRAQVESVAETCRKLVSNHDVFGYYAAEYGLDVPGSVIPSTTTAAQASASDVAEIVQRVREQGVPAVFAEASVNPALIEQVGREAGVAVVTDLYGDSLGDEDSEGATYVEMMRANTSKIVTALRDCDA